MTVKQFIKKHGWSVECDASVPYRYMNINIAFENEERLDETQFSIRAYDVNELSVLFNTFCKEEGCKNNTVTAIYVVEVAETMEQLS